ncbi:RagB/SusD family nutrient uptake outer membrane protein [Chitinophaga caeni]|uniref:RagB/SusD family nutrient uptake outer membrane protein n=1 Tax=Chitinophaga caeni TaxID=2029983 RepID=A0A291QZ82_9BACT|nr:RagB/SusD family nutrient uptake outer membrane protein [Chitinophaga caeni]ATL49296.1 RagB/SusD family nutrient uptake outer membrane protein [Chitinophaga caeni]
MKQALFLYTCMMLIAGSMMSSCKKLIEIGPSKDQLASNSVFLDSTTAEAALIGMYANVANPNPGNDLGTSVTIFNSMSADETYPYSMNYYDDFTNNSLTPLFYYIEAVWNTIYKNIYIANSVINGLPSSPLSEFYKQRATGEAKFIRAYCYFYLVNEYGGVPIVTSTDVHSTTNQPRNTQDEVYDQIEKDLRDAVQVLPSTLEYYGGKRIRATTWAANALLARVYLYRKKWELAENAATTVINNPGLFKMNDSLNQVFLANNTEGILQFVNGITSSWIANNFVPNAYTITPKFVIQDGLFEDFEPGDQRKAKWVGYKSYGGIDYPYPAKYVYSAGVGAVEYNQVLRLSEQYLIRAEARAQRSNFLQAASDIDSVRLRAGLQKTTANDKLSLMAAIEHENRVEFFCEWGHRWLDLKRLPGHNDPSKTRADEVLSEMKGSLWQSTDALYPIPQGARNSNRNLDQNDGYF